MSSSDKQMFRLVVGSIAVIGFLGWLRSNPRCDRGCQTQLEHLQEHVAEDLIRSFLA
jgi:hypothetical protein